MSPESLVQRVLNDWQTVDSTQMFPNMQDLAESALKVKVFTNSAGQFGDACPVVTDVEREIGPLERSQIAAHFAQDLNAPETVFIESSDGAQISIVHEDGELDFAGVSCLAAASLTSESYLQTSLSEFEIVREGDLVGLIAGVEKLPSWNLVQLESGDSVSEIDAAETKDLEHTIVWGWVDEGSGLIRARTFLSDWGVLEAEGNGSGVMLLAASLGRSIEVVHGAGSVIFSSPIDEENVKLSGRVAEVS